MINDREDWTEMEYEKADIKKRGKLLHVLKINHIAASLFLCKQPCKGCHKKDQIGRAHV